MSPHRSLALLSLMLLLLLFWAAPAPVTAKGPDEGPTSLYRLEPTFGRILSPINGVTLNDTPVYSSARMVGGTGTSPGHPRLVFSPHRRFVAYVTNTCQGCSDINPAWERIRLTDLDSGVQSAAIRPQRGIEVVGVSDDGSVIRGLDRGPNRSSETVWLRLNGRTGQVMSRAAIGESCCPLQQLYDPATDQIVATGSDSRGDLSLTSYDIASGRVLRSLTLDDVVARYRISDVQQDGQPTMYGSPPVMALSPDGRTIAIVSGDEPTLTMVVLPEMRVLSTQAIHRSQSGLERLMGNLGLLPSIAEAKMVVGTTRSTWFSSDGRSLFVTGTRGYIDEQGRQAHQAIGLQQVDLASGEVKAASSSGLRSVWVGEAADGSALYSLDTLDPEGLDCPCLLHRLDPITLATTAERRFETQPQLFIVR